MRKTHLRLKFSAKIAFTGVNLIPGRMLIAENAFSGRRQVAENAFSGVRIVAENVVSCLKFNLKQKTRGGKRVFRRKARGGTCFSMPKFKYPCEGELRKTRSAVEDDVRKTLFPA